MKFTRNNLNNIDIYESEDADSILEEKFGLTTSILMDVLTRSLFERNIVTELHPITSSGMRFYESLVFNLRELCIPLGYSPLRKDNIELVSNDKYAIWGCHGDKAVASPIDIPTSKRSITDAKKRLLGIHLDNHPFSYQLFIDEPFSRREHQGMEVWALMYHCMSHIAEDGSGIKQVEVRAELSKPSSYNEKGFINYFSTRIILPIITLNGSPDLIDDDYDDDQFNPDIDIDIGKG